jgi:putative spermidine/putrescine transport system ATP-binding protein
LTVEQNIAFPLRMRHVAKKDLQKRVSEVLELVGLSGLAGRYPRELSGGQQQRVAVARGLVFRPEVLLLDEPLGALDKNLREQMQIELKRIHREVGITMIYVTHDQSEAMTMSDRIAVFNRGRLEQVEAPLEIYHRPATKFVGAFVGDSNFYDGSFDAERCELTINGLGMVRALPGRDMAFGTSGKKHIMIRPERLRVVDRVDSDDSTFDIVIRESINYGDSVLLIGSAGDLSVRVRTHASAHIGQGDTIKVAMRSADIHVIARD